MLEFHLEEASCLACLLASSAVKCLCSFPGANESNVLPLQSVLDSLNRLRSISSLSRLNETSLLLFRPPSCPSFLHFQIIHSSNSAYVEHFVNAQIRPSWLAIDVSCHLNLALVAASDGPGSSEQSTSCFAKQFAYRHSKSFTTILPPPKTTQTQVLRSIDQALDATAETAE